MLAYIFHSIKEMSSSMLRIRKRRRNEDLHPQINHVDPAYILLEQSLSTDNDANESVTSIVSTFNSLQLHYPDGAMTSVSVRSSRKQEKVVDSETMIGWNNLKDNTTNNTNTIYVASSCLIIPVVVAIWWYYTKKSARKFRRKLLLLTHHVASSSQSNCTNNNVSDEPHGIYYVPSCSDSSHDQNHETSNEVTIIERDDDIDNNLNGLPVTTKEDCYQSWDEIVLEQQANDRETELNYRLVRWLKVGRKHNSRHQHSNNVTRRPSLSRQSLRQRNSIFNQQSKEKKNRKINNSKISNNKAEALLSVFPNQSLDSLCVVTNPITNDYNQESDNGSECSMSSTSEGSISSSFNGSLFDHRRRPHRRRWQCIPDTTAAVEICSMSLQQQQDILKDNSADNVLYIMPPVYSSNSNNNNEDYPTQYHHHHPIRQWNANNIIQNSVVVKT